MSPLFSQRWTAHRRRAAWAAWWDAQRRVRLDQRFTHGPAFDADEDDWLRLSERGILIGTTGFVTPDGALPVGPWPMHGGYFEKMGWWVRGAGPMDWIGSGQGWTRRQRQRLEIRPQTVGITLSPRDELPTLEGLDDRSVLETLEPWELASPAHPFNAPGTGSAVHAVLERRPRGRPLDDHPVLHVFGSAWWTRSQVEATVERAMDLVRERLPDGQWLDPFMVPDTLAGFGVHDVSRGRIFRRLSDLIDHRDFRSDGPDVLPSPGDRQRLMQAGGQRLLDAAELQWRASWQC